MRRNRGFTLIEIMLVMAIIAIIASAVMLTLPSDRQSAGKAHDLAATLKYQFSVAREYAMLRQRPVGLYLNQQQQRYEFLEWQEQRWQPLRKKGLKPQSLQHIDWQFEQNDGFAVMANEQQRDDFLITKNDEEQDDDETLLQPQVFILPSGEIGEFSLALRHRDELDHVYLQTISPWQLALADEAEAYE